MDRTQEELQGIARQFQIEDGSLSIMPFGHGHINSTDVVEYEGDLTGEKRLILQLVNTTVFPKIRELTENMAAVTQHLKKKIIEAGGDPRRETLNMKPLKAASDDGRVWERFLYKEADGTEDGSDYWRMFLYVTGASSYEQPRRPEDLYQAGAAFGRFQHMLSDFPA